jgi:hypothetical protein
MVILPALSISTREIPTPAAATALMALVTSCCLHVEGARDINGLSPHNWRPDLLA